jgi:hypothetical protein
LLDVGVVKPQDDITICLEICSSLLVILAMIIMMMVKSVQFDNQSLISTEKIHDIRSERTLPSELQPAQSPATKSIP